MGMQKNHKQKKYSMRISNRSVREYSFEGVTKDGRHRSGVHQSKRTQKAKAKMEIETKFKIKPEEWKTFTIEAEQ